jgi:hypothetical protein
MLQSPLSPTGNLPVVCTSLDHSIPLTTSSCCCDTGAITAPAVAYGLVASEPPQLYHHLARSFHRRSIPSSSHRMPSYCSATPLAPAPSTCSQTCNVQHTVLLPLSQPSCGSHGHCSELISDRHLLAHVHLHGVLLPPRCHVVSAFHCSTADCASLPCLY